ncbi:SHOCT domain-containing protein [Pseudodesulfovibrio sp. JC047]|uniref:SHOCT domain-containing protein n=1 Tax=Pseudodesulfovibrio sp. JC047 TaxID=2683199 RepID=UPI0013D61E10|nr:SHOCT domain-containing protein [Pseudodesulfovibrio sp. JC047]NDV20579.1 SHOCT domain-containing protein [Pseudodesulfovibrio sp. JC047]
MFFNEIPSLFAGFFDFLNSPQWKAWPFNSGYGEHLWPAIARFAFISVIMGGILLFLRLLFGPGGPLRDKELEQEAQEETARERAEVEALFAQGEISEMDYKIRMKKLKD